MVNESKGKDMEILRRAGVGMPGGVPMTLPTPEEARSVALARSRQIFENWEILRLIIERHEATIQKRWAKKTKEGRKKLLLAAWPHMSKTHRPDFEAFRTKPSQDEADTREDRRSAYLWPHINLEDLSKAKLLLLFLNSRGRNPPCAFAEADFEACRFGRTTGTIGMAYLNKYTMMFNGRKTPETYGELWSWNDNPDGFHLLATGRGVLVGVGLVILDVQNGLYKFLVEVCKTILHDVPEAALVDASIPSQPEPPSVSAEEDSLAITSAEAPYRLPAALDLKRLEFLVAAKLADAEDHILALREDPGYFAADMLDWSEHRQERMVDTLGKKHPIFKDRLREPMFWRRVVGQALTTALRKVEVFYALHEQIVNLQVLQAKYSQSINPDKDLPEEYAFAFYSLHYHLDNLTKDPIQLLTYNFLASPPVRPYFVRMPQEEVNSRESTIILKNGLPKDKEQFELLWIMKTLFDDRELEFMGLNTLMDELVRLSHSSSTAQQLMTSWVDEQISDLSTISQCLHQIQLYQPWAATFPSAMMDEVTEKKLFDIYVGGVEKSMECYDCLKFRGRLGTLGDPSEGKFRYPVDKPRNLKNVNALREAEANLDAFWMALCQDLKDKDAMTPRFQKLLAYPLQRTPPWVDTTGKAKSDEDALAPPMDQLRLGLEQSTERTLGQEAATARKEKAKTRGVASTVVVPAAQPEEAQLPEKRLTFRVDKRALKVFKTVFFVPSAANQPGEIMWGDFVHAMASTGFKYSAIGGSKRLFTPTILDVERGIQFHEPHPISKIPYTMARRFGRRLNRAYGWEGDMFVLK